MPLCFLEDQCFCFIFARVFAVFSSAQFVAGFSQPRKKKEILDFLCIFRMSYVQNIFAFSELLDQRIQIVQYGSRCLGLAELWQLLLVLHHDENSVGQQLNWTI